jgi:hypothetical protein
LGAKRTFGRDRCRSEAHTLSDFDVVEVRIDLDRAGPLASGMKVDVFFRRSETAQQQ